jgi:hypothetical protein
MTWFADLKAFARENGWRVVEAATFGGDTRIEMRKGNEVVCFLSYVNTQASIYEVIFGELGATFFQMADGQFFWTPKANTGNDIKTTKEALISTVKSKLIGK